MAEVLKLIKVQKVDNPQMFDYWTMRQWEKLGNNKNGWMIVEDEVHTPPEVLEIKSKSAQVEAKEVEIEPEVIGASEAKPAAKKPGKK